MSSCSLRSTALNLLDEADVAKAARAVAVHYIVFDQLHLDGRSLLHDSYDERRASLERSVVPDARSRVQVPTAFDGDFDADCCVEAEPTEIRRAVGNLVDRITTGRVIDFIDFSAMMFPWVFNVADSAITVGVIILLLAQLTAPNPPPNPPKTAA